MEGRTVDDFRPSEEMPALLSLERVREGDMFPPTSYFYVMCTDGHGICTTYGVVRKFRSFKSQADTLVNKSYR